MVSVVVARAALDLGVQRSAWLGGAPRFRFAAWFQLDLPVGSSHAVG